MANEVSVKQHTVMNRTLRYCEEKITGDDFTELVLVGEGKAVNKAISILEILKRKCSGIVSTISLDESPNTNGEPRLRIVISRENC